jgi:hypothetical protein
MEPANQAAVAYTLTSLFPEIDPAIARYRIKRYDEGFSELDFNLAINMDELLQTLEVLNPYIQARADNLKKQSTKQQPAEKDPTGSEQRIEELKAELLSLGAS